MIQDNKTTIRDKRLFFLHFFIHNVKNISTCLTMGKVYLEPSGTLFCKVFIQEEEKLKQLPKEV